MHSNPEGAASNNNHDQSTSLLDIRVSETFDPPSEKHNLLLGFQFGSGLEPPTHPAIISLHLRPLNHEQLTEAWWYEGEVKFTKSDSVRVAECQEYTVAIFQKETDASKDFSLQARQAYGELITAVRSTKHTKLVKIWNYFDEINNGDGDLERYRQFSIGRAEAFQDMGINDDHAPTGTAIGTQNSGSLALIAIASNHHYHPVENPRQTSAFHYPRIYGPKSPKFSRGGFVSSETHRLFLISGTAAVVGHESSFPYNTHLQSEETFKNLAYLCDSISEMDLVESQFSLDNQSVLRVYLKNPDDYHLVSKKMNEQLNANGQHVAYLHGTICRKELTVEIDGVKVV